jgi:PAS domain S-box-containing protein
LIAERPDGSRARVIPYPTPLFDKNGELIGGINMLVDVSARLKSEQELARLGAVIASSEDAVIGVNLQGIVTHWNEGATQLYNYESHEMIGQPIESIVPPELHAQEFEILEKLRRGERVKNYETERVGKGGRRISISLSASMRGDAPLTNTAPKLRTIVFHGDADSIVAPSNGANILSEADFSPQHSQVTKEYTKRIARDARGLPLFEHWLLHGGGHAWSGGNSEGSYADPSGPNASAEMIRFFLGS